MADLIDRQAAIDAIESTDWYHQNRNGEMVHGANSSEHQAWYKADEILAVIENLPSTQSERKTGRWTPIPSLFRTLGICSVCHNVAGNEYEYCPWCGTKMEVEHDND